MQSFNTGYSSLSQIQGFKKKQKHYLFHSFLSQKSESENRKDAWLHRYGMSSEKHASLTRCQEGFETAVLMFHLFSAVTNLYNVIIPSQKMFP